MAVTDGPRFGLTRWGVGADPLSRAQMDGDHAALEALAAIAIQGLAADRPAAGAGRRFYFATDTRLLSYDTGAAWLEVAEVDAGGLRIIRRQLPTNKLGSDAPGTYPLGFSYFVTDSPFPPAPTGWPVDTNAHVTTVVGLAARAEQMFAATDGRRWMRASTGGASPTWTAWREILARNPDGIVPGGVTFDGGVTARGVVVNGGFDFILGNVDQVTRGDTGPSRALVKFGAASLIINFGGDFTGGLIIGGPVTAVDGRFRLGMAGAGPKTTHSGIDVELDLLFA